MSNKPMPWIKQYPTRLHDVRLAALNDRQQLRYFQMYLLAGQLNSDGAFIQDGKELSVIELGYLLRVTDCKQLEKDLAALRKSKLIRVNGHGPFIADFKDEQINWLDKQEDERRRKALQRSREAVTRDTDVTDEMSHGGHAPRTRIKNQNQIKKESKNQPTTPTPPSNELVGWLDGAMDELFSTAGFKDISKKTRAELTRIAQVLALVGLGKPKLITLIHKVTTRSTPKNKLQFVLAAIASVYADDSVRNKAIVAMHRIDAGTVPAQYFSPSTWGVIPDAVLKAAGDVGVKDEPRTPNKKIRNALSKLRDRSKA